RNGFCLWQKKLGKDKFPWPSSESDIQIIDLEKLYLLLKGIDFWKEHKSIYSKDFF
ncbi:MAG: transposase, partial [Deltaproteobacteria bacterium]|nr:transposase [Deltaproteobacteria bacterium]